MNITVRDKLFAYMMSGNTETHKKLHISTVVIDLRNKMS